jgi:hypothetical protein
LLTAEPIGLPPFPRRDWAVLDNKTKIGTIKLTGLGAGSLVLYEQCYSTEVTPHINPFSPYVVPRQYSISSDGRVLHLGVENDRGTYLINSTDNLGDSFLFRQSIWSPFLFGKIWYSYDLYARSDASPLGRIGQLRPFRNVMMLNLAATIAETVQIFLLWLVVDRLQWRASRALFP